MKSEKIKQIDWVLIRKWIDGELFGEERKAVERWMKADPSRGHFVKQAHQYYEKEIPVVDEEKIGAAWGRFIQTHQTTNSRKIFPWWIRGVAASVLIFVGAWFVWEQTHEAEKTVDVAQGEILPGFNQARLILSDGREVYLESQKESRILVDDDVNIHLDSTTLTYKDTGRQHDFAYNTIQVPRGGEYNLTLSDGTRVWLNSESSLKFPLVFKGDKRQVYLTGEGYFEVTPGKKHFIVAAGEMEIRVLGTSFNVNAYENEEAIRTTLVKGKVEILAEGVTSRVLAPGEQSVWERGSDQIKVVEVNTSLYTQWKEGRFVFRDNTLRHIMKTLSHWYDMEYEFASPELEELCFYGVIGRFEHVQGLLSQFEKTGKVQFEYKGNRVIIK